MAIDRNKIVDIIQQIDDIFDSIPGDEKLKEWVKTAVMGPTINIIRNLVEESRTPIMLLFGRSGHGKSSLINALSNQLILDTTDEIRPNTTEATEYNIEFEGKFSSWKVIDTRGIFESCKPGNLSDDATEALIKAIDKYRPDVLMHVIAARDVRNIGPDLQLYKKIIGQFSEKGRIMPTVICITQVDTLNPPTEWPLKSTSSKAANIIELMHFLAQDVLGVETRKYDLNSELKGLIIDPTETNPYVGIFPLCTYWTEEHDNRWNIETLASCIGDNLPEVACLDFFQAIGLKTHLKSMSDDIIKRFASIAGAIGFSPVPFTDMALLLPLQMLMIAIIGGLSCRPLSIDTANEYLAAAGINAAGGLAARQIARQLFKFIPGGAVVAGAVAASATYGMGKAAEFYFFDNQLVQLATLAKQY